MGKRIGEKLSTVDHDDLTTEEWIKLYGSTSSYPNKVPKPATETGWSRAGLKISDRLKNKKILDWLLPGPGTTRLEVRGK